MRRPSGYLGAAFLVGAAIAGSAMAAASAFDIDAVAGVYKHRFQDGLVDGSKYVGEDVLEVVKVDPTTAYLRTHLDFYNGHTCTLWGMAKVEGDALVYRSRQDIVAGRCVLSLRVEAGKLAFTDEGGRCRTYYCGARGVLDGVGFPVSSRRPIRYMPRLLASREYDEARKELETGEPQP